MSTVTAVPLQPVKRRVLVYVWIGIALAVVAAAALATQAPRDPVTVALAKIARSDHGIRQTPSGLMYKVLTPGTPGASPTDGDVALITYQGRLLNGTVFDASSQPTPLPLAGVIPGFSEGMKLMTKGAKYRFWLKPSLGYGDKASGPIPAHSALVFDVTLLDWKSEAEIRQMQAMQQMMQQQGARATGTAPAAGPPPGGQ